MAAVLTLSGAVITIPGKVLASESVHLSEDGGDAGNGNQ